jgi:N-acetylglucosaminyldiphosphoundecaprenol N-acetyl-beta-D-mannosaminyltransferase
LNHKANILGVNIDLVRLEDVLCKIQTAVLKDARALITHVNITGLHIAYEQEWFRDFLNRSDLVFCDGMGVKLGARLLGHNIPERFTLADWMWILADRCVVQDFSFFFLGNPKGVAERAAISIKSRFPNLKILGTQHGFFDKSPGSLENERVVGQINNLKPNILMVGLGMPVQERWLMENWERLNVNVAITCGAIFEYLSGDLKRGPQWMTDYYMEWLARLIISPRRYLKRYMRDIPFFWFQILKQKYSQWSIPWTM